MFMHGGLAHLGGNLLFLYIFGDNVEDAMGHRRYVLFYLVSGVCAAAAQVLIDPTSPTPMVGASGAIAGVLGADSVLYPRAPITVFVFFFLLSMPAWVVIGGWFALQVLGARALDTSSGGVAVYAHIGGFLAGVLAIRPAMIGRERLHASRFTGFRNLPPRNRFGLPRPRGSQGSGLPGPGPGRWDPGVEVIINELKCLRSLFRGFTIPSRVPSSRSPHRVTAFKSTAAVRPSTTYPTRAMRARR